jgi:hypothetical protein
MPPAPSRIAESSPPPSRRTVRAAKRRGNSRLGALAVLFCGLVSGVPAFAQAVLPGMEYREAWTAGPWKGAALYDRGSLLTCEMSFVPAPGQAFSISSHVRAPTPRLVFQSGNVDPDAFFRSNMRSEPAQLAIGAVRRDLSAGVKAASYIDVPLDDALVEALAGGGAFSLALRSGRHWEFALPAETAAAVAAFGKCRREHGL